MVRPLVHSSSAFCSLEGEVQKDAQLNTTVYADNREVLLKKATIQSQPAKFILSDPAKSKSKDLYNDK